MTQRRRRAFVLITSEPPPYIVDVQNERLFAPRVLGRPQGRKVGTVGPIPSLSLVPPEFFVIHYMLFYEKYVLEHKKLNFGGCPCLSSPTISHKPAVHKETMRFMLFSFKPRPPFVRAWSTGGRRCRFTRTNALARLIIF